MKGASHCDSAIAKQQSKSSPAVVSSDAPLGRLALYLLSEWQGAGRDGLIFICGDERRAEQLGAIVHAFDRQANVMVLPSLGSVPFDDVEPPPEILGRRSSVLRRLAGQDSALLIATAVSLSRRVPPPDAMRNSALCLACGGRFDEEHIRGFLAGGGYTLDERIDSPGMANFLGHALEIFAAGALRPVRIGYECGRIIDIHTYDLTDQRDRDTLDDVVIDVVRECDDGDSEASESSRRFATATVFEYRPSPRLIADHGMDAHARRWFDRIAGDDASLFLTRKDWERCLADGDAVVLPATSSEPDLPTFYSDDSSTRSFRNFLGQKEKDRRRIIFAAATKRDLRAMARRAGIDSTLCDSWSQAVNAPRRHPAAILADLDRGFESADGCVVVSAVDLFGSRATHQDIMSVGLRKNIGDRELSLGDVVIHLDRGMAILSELATVVTEGVPDAEMIRLEFADKDHILLPVSDLKAIWRYSSESDGIRLDKADGSSWLARRGQAEADIVATASHISERIAERRERRTAPIVPPAADYENFAAGFEYSITADQGRAIADVLSDLASHRPMDRLICGDVGYGKTEVALRATAATVLAGKQVAIVAPTTVLALQHLETFRRRFKPLGLVVGLLSRFTTTTDARAVKKALADGSLSIVIGTHALAGNSVTFKNLGLLVIDEEQHLGQAQKAKLAALANELHVLTMTATPIPRTLNEVRAGLRALSIISTPPVRRMPVKTIVEPFNDALVTSALRREHRRRGQSFLVCPRVQDIAPMAQKLQGLVPELKTIAVHGKMPAADIDKAMLTFAARGADILLATDIIESGLDLPHANTIIVWRPDKFGLAQLHQLRGRVGRRSARAFALFLTDPAAKLSRAAVARLDKLQKLNDQGAGFLISAGDMDMRGGGDLLSEKQSGHIQLLGSDLSAHLLDLAIGDAAPASLFEKRPDVRLDVPALLPAAYVKDASIRLELYARIFRCGSARELENVEDEIEERFGDLPSEARDLLRLARFELDCVTLGIMSVDVGPKSLAATFDPARGRKLPKRFRADDRLEWKDGRLIYRRPSAPPERLAAMDEFVDIVAGFDAKQTATSEALHP